MPDVQEPEAESSPPESVPAGVAAPAASRGTPSGPEADTGKQPGPAPLEDLPPVAPVEPLSTAGASPPPLGPDDGCDFVLQFNCARVFLLGYSFAFDFLLTAKGRGARECENISISLEFAFREPITRCIAGLGVHGSREVSLFFEPRRAGVGLPATVFLTYTKGDEQKRFEADIRWSCFPPDEPSASVIENMTLVFRDIEARGAADMNIRLLENFGATHPDSTAKQLRQLDLMPVWKTLRLVRAEPTVCIFRRMPPPPPEAVTDRLTLRQGDLRVHLLCGEELTLGKNWRNDIATHVFTPQGAVDEELTSRISRSHARLRRSRGGCRVVDGGYDPQSGRERGSAYGTYCDGRLLGKLQGTQLRAGSHASFGLARCSDDGSPCLGLDAYVWCCDPVRRRGCGLPLDGCREDGPACLVLKRTDGLRADEVFVVVWRCCPLVLVDDAFGDMTVWRQDRHGAFGATLGTSHFWLTRGVPVSAGKQEITVGDMEQAGLERYAERRRNNGGRQE